MQFTSPYCNFVIASYKKQSCLSLEMHICWLDSCRVPRKYKNAMHGTKCSSWQGWFKGHFETSILYNAMASLVLKLGREVTFELAKPGLDILFPAYDFFTEWYGKLSNQQIYFFGQCPLCILLSGSNHKSLSFYMKMSIVQCTNFFPYT